MRLNVNVSLAAFPGLRHEEAASLAIGMAAEGSLIEPALGVLKAEEVQLVPQSVGRLDEATCERLMQRFPRTRFRLHANVRVLERHRFADLANFSEHGDWFAQAARIHRLLGATGYSAHSGRRRDATFDQMADNARRCSDLFECPVAVEGQYPTTDDQWLVSTWDEYRQLFDSGLWFALDLSHLNILVNRTGQRNDGLVAEMLASDRCAEVHLSANDGQRDAHQICKQEEWWTPLLGRINPKGVVFSEGNHRRPTAPH